jgi:hypothetical protein
LDARDTTVFNPPADEGGGTPPMGGGGTPAPAKLVSISTGLRRLFTRCTRATSPATSFASRGNKLTSAGTSPGRS